MNTTTTTTSTFETRFTDAVKEIRKAGIVARRNVASCCRSCYDPKVADDQPIIWHFGGQGNAILIEGDSVGYRVREDSYYVSQGKVDSFYLQHSNLVNDDSQLTTNGQLVVDIFARHGVVIDWNQSQWSCIEIKVAESIAQ